jgi:hypothetical protein
MRTCIWPRVLTTMAAAAMMMATAFADDGGSIHVRMLREEPAEPLLHLDGLTLDPTIGEGGSSERHAVVVELGPRARRAAEGLSWQAGLTPSDTDDLRIHGWRTAAELTYDLGPFSVGMNVALTRDGDESRRMVGLFAFRTFHLSRWMHAWISFGVALEQVDADHAPPLRGMTIGLSLGTTFR